MRTSWVRQLYRSACAIGQASSKCLRRWQPQMQHKRAHAVRRRRRAGGSSARLVVGMAAHATGAAMVAAPPRAGALACVEMHALRVLGCVAQTREVVDAMSADAGCELRLLRADGGCSRNGLLMELQADALQVRALLPRHRRGRSRGLRSAARSIRAAKPCAVLRLMRSHPFSVPWSHQGGYCWRGFGPDNASVFYAVRQAASCRLSKPCSGKGRSPLICRAAPSNVT